MSAVELHRGIAPHRIGAMIEDHLERLGTFLCDTDDQHVVIIA